MLYSLGKVAKAVVGAAAAGTATLAVATADGSLSTGDVVTIVLAVLGSLGVVYAVPNRPEEG